MDIAVALTHMVTIRQDLGLVSADLIAFHKTIVNRWVTSYEKNIRLSLKLTVYMTM